jgi:superfamily II DNA/RNA helicase
MNTFDLHKEIIKDYKSYISSFINIKDERIRQKVEEGFSQNSFIPEPLIQFNPAYEKGCMFSKLIEENLICPELDLIFKGFALYKHQEEAIRIGSQKKGFVVTSGTGSGKSLTYLASIFNHVINSKDSKGIKAVIVYPMNALINSQEEEIHKYRINYLASFLMGNDSWDKSKALTDQISELESKVNVKFPMTYAKYTGQEKEETRIKIRENNPDIILTNYMMLELIMTRQAEGVFRDSMHNSLQYLVFDELHTYRGRQGADVSMLIRRIQAFCSNDLTIIGTSATMASGTIEEQKNTVAIVASQIFGKLYLDEQIITESLVFSTRADHAIDVADLIREIRDEIIYPLDEIEFQNNSVAIWLESECALLRHPNGFVEKRKPTTLSSITNQLSALTQEPEPDCKSVIIKILLWGEQLNIQAIKNKERKSFLPFKLHQFISQTGTAYLTLDRPEDRFITLDEERYALIDDKKKYLYSVLFSRHSGQEFICVELDFDANTIKPRQSDDYNESLTQDEFAARKKAGLTPTMKNLNKGYILFDSPNDQLWSDEMLEDMPGTWYKVRKDGTLKANDYHNLFLPRLIYFNSSGEFSLEEDGLSLKAWYMATGMLFDPTSGIIYDSRTSENTKLMRLGNEGRSTATTMTTISVLKAMQNQNEERRKQKLLSFTDNRQDASLQAGHFNDFITTVRLRSAIYHALQNNAGHSLSTESIAIEVKEQLNLKEVEFARRPALDESIPNQTNQKALEKYIFLRIMYDLKKGWRYILPNLELCGLMKFDFEGLESVSLDGSLWKGNLLLDELNNEIRHEILSQILNYFRQSYAIDHHFFDGDEIEKNEAILKDNLDTDKIWSLDSNERIDKPYTLFLTQIPDTLKHKVFYASAGTRSNLGKYLKRNINKHKQTELTSDELSLFIEDLFHRLSMNHFLVTENFKHGDETFIGYRLNTQKLVWKLADGEKVYRDQVNNYYYKDAIELIPNSFFKVFYKQNFNDYVAKLIAREHTGQIDKDERIEREKQFRNGDIAALFCSPTMELGIDIAELNVVHMRNVPPSPANYAQRSGRAGRSGQTALVLNYCAIGSPHDRHYFNDSMEMVAGVVIPPRIDMTNRELLHAHINAYLFMEMRLKDVKNSVSEVLDLQGTRNNLPIKIEILNLINDLIANFKDDYFKNIKAILGKLEDDLQNSNWYNDAWITNCIEQFCSNFDNTFSRWRLLFQNAITQRDIAQVTLNDYTVKESHPSKKEARKIYNTAQNQIQLLLNQEDGKRGESEFYIFRYLASEGFFPGYNFIRLPIRCFLGRRNEGGTYISRPRFIALREFGPQNIIYHNGTKYRINKLVLPNNQFDNNKRRIKICLESGYAFMNHDGDTVNNDPITKQALDGGDRVAVYDDLLEVTETNAEPQDRISSIEEERVRLGYDVGLYFNFPEGTEAAIKSAIKNDGEDLINLWFYKAANLIEVNHKWKSGNGSGFLLNKRNGKFEQNRNINEDNVNDIVRARLYTTDTSDIILIQPVEVLGLDSAGIASFAFALKRAIERMFQVEESEIGVHIVGNEDVKNILIYEASEGSLGILSQLAENTNLLNELFIEAYKVCHFDPATRIDTQPEVGPASYKDLLSYYNQIYHDQLDRHKIKDALEKLMDCDSDNNQHFNSREENFRYLYDNYDRLSTMEKDFIDALYQYGCKLPDKAQVNLSGIADTYASADFLYSDEKVLVFIDGNVHDREEIANADDIKRKALRNAGFIVLVWNYKEPIEDFLENNKHIFRCKTT